MDEAETLEALSQLLTQLSTNPYDISLHAQHIKLASSSGLEDQVQAAREMMTGFWPAGDDVWLPMIEAKEKSIMDANTSEAIQEMLQMFELAEADYLSLPVLQKHIEFITSTFTRLSSLEQRPDDLGELFTVEWTGKAIYAVVQKGIGHLTQGHTLWEAERDWEQEQLETASPKFREILIELLGDLHLSRLKQIHSSHEATLQSYSTFVTTYHPAEAYEKLLVAASKAKNQAVKGWDKREPFETSLTQNKYAPEAYAYYIQFERKPKNPDLTLTRTVYERAIADTAKLRFEGNAVAEAALRTFWIGYIDILRVLHAANTDQLNTLRRAARSVPGSGEVWARYIRFLERTTASGTESTNISETISDVYDRALATGLLQKDAEQLVPLVLARAGYEKRIVESSAEGERNFETLVAVLEVGIQMVKRGTKLRDPRYRLEKYLSDLYLNLVDTPDKAAALWQATTKNHKSSYLAWTSYTDSLIKTGEYDIARGVFKDIHTKNLDWPEAIFEAWISFENLHGSVEEIEECLDKVERAQGLVNTRRAKEAEKAAYQAAQIAPESLAISAPVEQRENQETTDGMDVDVPESSEDSKKRKAGDSENAEGSKKAKMEKSEPPKRDRENCTVFVADLPDGVTKAELDALFEDCGIIKEIKITKLPNAHVATVEFAERDSVPAALTKDKKRINGHEVAVHLAWKSTLYVTNFPEHSDDASMRELFGTYGAVFDVRWPSKKFKNTRRFCYVQYTSTKSAEAALELHGRELVPGLPLNVYISNPERKKDRTDANANDREVYVAGLSKFANKKDLEDLFTTYGVVKEIRMASDHVGQSKGFAFVEFEDEASAQKALQANNHELKNRRMAVTLADTRVRARDRGQPSGSGLGPRDDIKNRSIRIKKLPAGTQEGLLQQVLEKVTPIKRLEIFEDKREAIVELESAADAGKLLLITEPIMFNGVALQMGEEPTDAQSQSAAKSGGLFVPRGAVSRPRAGLGSKKRTEKGSNTSTFVPAAKSSLPGGKGQDDFRKMLG
ncbi:hypothetical protein BD410DRAFT_788782 [Rickenella mellea]|uniref:U4/U6 snRNA-associated-splicing factor PRP24 n=1 Tax=Rickenella mellea TaxID=50990 RepID=A0A4Y7Q452_9AGAM|nr:hypothetical protein BD410DRAFT_788782 [Rickenella mellea]